MSRTQDKVNAHNELLLVGRVLSQKPIDYRAIVAMLELSWNLGPNVSFQALDKMTITCSFKRAEDRDKVLDSGPWAIKGATLNLQKWPSHLTLTEIDFTGCPF